MLGNGDTIAWLTRHTAVVRGGERVVVTWLLTYEPCHFSFSADGKEINVLANRLEHPLGVCDVLLRLLAVSDVHSVRLNRWGSTDGVLVPAPTLAYMVEQCQSLKVLTLEQLALDEDHIRVIGAYSRPGLEIELKECRITGAAAASVLAEVFGRIQGPTKLFNCYIDHCVLANGLRGCFYQGMPKLLFRREPRRSRRLRISLRLLLRSPLLLQVLLLSPLLLCLLMSALTTTATGSLPIAAGATDSSS
jgi:hypothetical protein